MAAAWSWFGREYGREKDEHFLEGASGQHRSQMRSIFVTTTFFSGFPRDHAALYRIYRK